MSLAAELAIGGLKFLTVARVDARFWRMLTIRWQREPLSGRGAALGGGRWNRAGVPALYLAADHATAVAEFHQDLLLPGTLAAYDVESTEIVDLNRNAERRTVFGREALLGDWRPHAAQGGSPLTWQLADRLMMAGAHGALAPSAQRPGGINLVLWRWSPDGTDGAHVRLIDPRGDLS